MKEKTVWFGEHRGIRFEVNSFESYDKDAYERSWTYYLWLIPEQFPESFRHNIKTDIYYSSFGTPFETYRGAIENLNWHSGLTWSSNETKPGHPFEQYKFGCDFQHLWDMHHVYTINSVKSEVEACIDSLHTLCPEIKPIEVVWNEFRKKFPGEGHFAERFDVNGNKVQSPKPEGDV